MRKVIGCYGALVALLVIVPGSARALDWAVDVHAGTLGFGVGGTIKITRNLNTRFGINTGDLGIVDVEDDEGLNYDDPTFDFDNTYGFVDWYPSRRSKFRFSAGIILNDNTISAGALVDTLDQQVGGVTAPVGTRVSGEVSFDDLASYAGVGWGNAFGRGGAFNFGFDLGIMFQGSPVVDLTVVDPSNTITQADVEQERQDLQNEVDDIDIWPVVSFSFGYRF